MSTANITAYILAGGQSRRMGQDKLFIDIDGVSLIDRVIATCRNSFSSVKIVAREQEKFSTFGLDVLIDVPQAEGPMAGLITALNDCTDTHCFITAADLYDLTPTVITKLLDQYNGEQFIGVHETNGYQPLCGIYSKDSLSVFEKLAKERNFKMRDAVAQLRHRSVSISQNEWRNLNRPADLNNLGRADG